MNKFVVKKLIAIFISAAIFVAIFVTIKILNQTDYIQVEEPNTKDIIPSSQKNAKDVNIKITSESTTTLYK